jgi:DNA polymerase-3 subunit delta'
MSKRNDPPKPSKAEVDAREEALAQSGGPAPPAGAAAGFAAIVGQQQAIAGLRRALERNRLSHAVLFHGPAGIGKATTAGILAQALNCAERGFVDACGACVSCRKVARGLHPDVLWVAPQRGMIRIGQVSPGRPDVPDAEPPNEPIVSWIGYRPYEGRRRVVVIDDAHTMNPSAQNALLKSLEEPPPSSILVLVTPAPGGLLPTIRSRCQPLRFQPLPPALLRQHLEEARGLPPEEARLRAALAAGSLGRAIDLDLDEHGERRNVAEAAVADARDGGAALLATAETLLAAGAGERKIEQATSAIGAVRDVLRDLLVLAATDDEALVANLDRAGEWRDWAAKIEPDALIAALDAVQDAGERLRSPLQPNARLTVEEALIGVGAALRGGRR